MSGSSKSDQPRGKHDFSPSRDVTEKMRPISRHTFHNILQRAAKPLPGKPASKTR